MSKLNKYWQQALFGLVYAAIIGNIGFTILLFVKNGRAMRANPDTHSHLGIFLLACWFILAVLISYWVVLLLIKFIPNDNIWKSVALFIFSVLLIGPLLWMFLQ